MRHLLIWLSFLLQMTIEDQIDNYEKTLQDDAIQQYYDFRISRNKNMNSKKIMILIIQALDSSKKNMELLTQMILSFNHSIHQKIDSLVQKIDLLDQKIDLLDQKIDSLGQAIDSLGYSLSQKIDSLGYSFGQKTDSLDTKIPLIRPEILLIRPKIRFSRPKARFIRAKFDSLGYSLGQRFDPLTQSTQAFYDGHKTALKIAYNSSCMIKIKTQDFIIHGYGNLIVVNDKFYISTCLHVLYDDYTNTFPDNITIILNDNGVMTIGREILIFGTRDIDLALIEAFPTSIQQKYAVKVSDQYLFIGDSLIGVRFRKNYASIIDCKIIEMSSDATKQGDYQYRTNCDTGFGSSGTGYLNDEGFLVAIHNASGTYKSIRHNLDQEFSSIQLQEESRINRPMDRIIAKTKYTKISSYSNNSRLQIYDKNYVKASSQFDGQIQHQSKILSHDPQASVVSSRAIFDLINNATSRTRRVKFGDTIKLSFLSTPAFD